jgi:RNA polymerase sigma-70 factor, ECF subfamily
MPEREMQQDSATSRIGFDPAAFESFYRAHVEGVQRFVARRVSDRERAADLTADIFTVVIESAARYRADRGTPEAWLYGIARMVVSGERRRAWRERNATQRVLGRRLLDADDTARAEARLDAEAGARSLYAAMSALSPAQRAVLELVALDGLSAGEAAAALGIRPITARARLHRARRHMAARLDRADTSERRSPQSKEVFP